MLAHRDARCDRRAGQGDGEGRGVTDIHHGARRRSSSAPGRSDSNEVRRSFPESVFTARPGARRVRARAGDRDSFISLARGKCNCPSLPVPPSPPCRESTAGGSQARDIGTGRDGGYPTFVAGLGKEITGHRGTEWIVRSAKREPDAPGDAGFSEESCPGGRTGAATFCFPSREEYASARPSPSLRPPPRRTRRDSGGNRPGTEGRAGTGAAGPRSQASLDLSSQLLSGRDVRAVAQVLACAASSRPAESTLLR